MASKRPGFGTLAVHGGLRPDPATGACAVPIYQTAAYVFKDCDHAASLFTHDAEGCIYTRISNPTCEVFEARMSALEEGRAAVATASGQAATAYAVLTLASQGDHIVAMSNLYGGTYSMFSATFKRFGISATFVPPNDVRLLENAITPRTKAVYGETIGNPSLDVLDIREVASVAHDHGLPLIMDNTFATPYLCRPIEHGADIVLHSATKYICGHGTSIGGVIVDSGRFDWSGGRFPEFTRAEQGVAGVSWVDKFGDLAYSNKVRSQMVRDLGACLAPLNAFMFIVGLETLHVRMDRHCSNALAVARHLAGHPSVAWVRYPGLEGDPAHGVAKTYLSGGFGAMIAFGVKGGMGAGRKFADSVELVSLVANLGDARSLVVHPASTTHQQLAPEQRRAVGITDDMLRLSVGIEDLDDIIADVDQALAAATRP
ncbi:MAG: O-acetylhomoserine aminocarboxypropyltransferase/cysteine synthase [Firmicutes bacterium]|nr:O-acetylhomoserine aminocarboxypropyltransferase/cysteine synthase [Bacillota bacterium]